MKRLLMIIAIIILFTATALAAPKAELSIILTPERVKNFWLDGLLPVLTVDDRGALILASKGGPFSVGAMRFLFRTPTAVSDAEYAPDGSLLLVSEKSLGFYAGGRFHPYLKLPHNGMRIAVSDRRIYVYGGDSADATSIYLVDRERGHIKLCVMPQPIGAATADRDTLYFSVANDVYRMTFGNNMTLLCRIPGPAITSLTAGNGGVYFTAGRSVYAWKDGAVFILGEDLGDVVRWKRGSLYILDSVRHSLVRISHLKRIEMPTAVRAK